MLSRCVACSSRHPDIARPPHPTEEFLSQKGIVFWPSAANYIFCYFDDPVGLEKRLRERDILVRTDLAETAGVSLVRCLSEALDSYVRMS
eukprot:scaffold64815_cov34-Tisochrysis_lutea.AAC.2